MTNVWSGVLKLCILLVLIAILVPEESEAKGGERKTTFSLSAREGRKFARALNKHRSKLAKRGHVKEGRKGRSRRRQKSSRHLARAANMHRVHWDEGLAKQAALQLTEKSDSLPIVSIRKSRRQSKVARRLLKKHLHSITNQVQCNVTHCLAPQLEANEKGLVNNLPYQLIAADVQRVGCAFESHKHARGHGPRRGMEGKMFCISDGAPAVSKGALYAVGQACSACGEGGKCTNPRRRGLCVNHIRLSRSALSMAMEYQKNQIA